MTKQAVEKATRLSVAVALLTVSSYALAESVRPVRARAEHPHALQLKSGIVDLGSPMDVAAAAQRGDRPGQFVLQLDGPIDRKRRARLEAAGVVLKDYLPSNAYVAKLDGTRMQALAQLDFVRWAGPFRDDWKLGPELGQRQVKTSARARLDEQGLLNVVIVLFAGEDAEPAIDDLVMAGASVLSRGRVGDQWMIDATIPKANVAEFARVQAVQFIEDAPEGTERNDTNAWILQSNVEDYTPIWNAGIHGEGQIGGLIDGTIQVSHCAFADPAYPGGPDPDHRKVVAMRNTQSIDAHGTHTAGTMAGDSGTYGVYDQYDGIAFAARISFSEMNAVWNAPSTLYDRLVDAHNDGARVHSNSWGDDGTTEYTTWCRQIDEFSHRYEESLVLFAVTNRISLKTPENAKDVLAIAASEDAPEQDSRYRGGTGPTADGRRKPELFAPGHLTVSANYLTTCDWYSKSGTSMACPAVAGAGLLARQYFTDGFHPTGSPNAADALTPSGALIKAVLINSGADMTGLAGYPGNQEGWGRVLLDDSLYFPGDTARLLVQDVPNADGLSTGDEASFQIAVAGGNAPLRITLVFTDPPASVSASDPVINNLDLEVTTPELLVLLGNQILDGQSYAGGWPDPLNNVERVLDPLPMPGTYVITVAGTAVNVGTQGYALVVTGDVGFDCNGNHIPDDREVDPSDPDGDGEVSEDCDANRVPDECQPNFDDDDFIDACDPDIDGDGVLNANDVCEFTRPGTRVDAEGRPISDTQGNCRVDLGDYVGFVPCLLSSGPEIQAAPDSCIEDYDYDGGGDVDLADFAGFQNAFTGSE